MNRRVPSVRLVGLLLTALLASACVAAPLPSPVQPATAPAAATSVAPAQSTTSVPPVATPTSLATATAASTPTQESATAEASPSASSTALSVPATSSPGATATPFPPRLVEGRTEPRIIPGRTPVPLQDPTAAGQALEAFLTRYQSFGGLDGVFHIEMEGKVVLDKAYGYADLHQKRSNTLDTRFWILDISSGPTAAAVLTLQEQGKLNVQDPVCKYVPDCPATWKEMTIRHLLTRTDGLPDYTRLPGYVGWRSTPLPLEEVIGKFKNAPLQFAPPGSKWQPNPSGYVLASYIIEKASGMSFESYLKSAVLQPLGMNDTGLSDPGPNVAIPNAGVPAQRQVFSNGYGATGLYSTAADLARWAHALMGEGGLPETVRNLILADHLMLGPAPSDMWSGYGMFGGVNRGRLEFGINGVGEGFRNTVYFEPEVKLVVIALINSEKVDMQSFFTAFEKQIFAD